jgi:hypothetical protein
MAEQGVMLEDETNFPLAGMQVGSLGAGEQDFARRRRFPCRR